MNEDGNEVWVLKIQNARISDSGNYECQISYHDDMEKKLKMPVRLRVLGKSFLPLKFNSTSNITIAY